jgi:hypothetical protein
MNGELGADEREMPAAEAKILLRLPLSSLLIHLEDSLQHKRLSRGETASRKPWL